jgi:hypothetical protein
MTSFGSLVVLFLRDLVRRRMPWILAILALAFVAINYWAMGAVEQSVSVGETWSVATRRSSAELDDLASVVRSFASFVVILFAGQVAPESRRNGTAQFVLSLGVRRDVLAAAEFTAAAIALAIGTLIVHVGFSIPALRTGGVTWTDAAFGWPGLLLPLLGVAAAAFAWSLTASPFETYLVFVCIPLLAHALPAFAQGFPKGFPSWGVRGSDNLGLLFPDVSPLLAWPHASFGPGTGVAFVWSVAHVLCATAFWVALGTFRHRRHDFGSRAALK